MKIGKKGNQIKIGENEYTFSDLDSHKNEIIKKLEFAEHNDLEDMVFRMFITYNEIALIVVKKHLWRKDYRL